MCAFIFIYCLHSKPDFKNSSLTSAQVCFYDTGPNPGEIDDNWYNHLVFDFNAYSTRPSFQSAK